MDGPVTAFWRRLDVPGRDAARVQPTPTGFELFGQSVFLDSDGPTALRYVLDLDERWGTRSGHITGFLGSRIVDSHIVRTAAGWSVDGRNQGMGDVLDLDLGFTPATNMVQLRRIQLSIGEAADFDVAWIEGGEAELTRLPQHYTRTSELEYAYESPTVGYAATIVLQPSGFAADYPSLWTQEELPPPVGR